MIEFFIGIVLGGIFFGGLYLTVGKLYEVKNPSILFALSFILRMFILLAGLYYVSKDGYKGVLLTLLGIIVLRLIMVFTIKSKGKDKEMMRGD